MDGPSGHPAAPALASARGSRRKRPARRPKARLVHPARNLGSTSTHNTNPPPDATTYSNGSRGKPANRPRGRPGGSGRVPWIARRGLPATRAHGLLHSSSTRTSRSSSASSSRSISSSYNGDRVLLAPPLTIAGVAKLTPRRVHGGSWLEARENCGMVRICRRLSRPRRKVMHGVRARGPPARPAGAVGPGTDAPRFPGSGRHGKPDRWPGA